MGLIAAMLLSQATAVQPPTPQPVSLRVTATARVEILAVGRAGPAESPENRRRLVRQEQGAAMTIFE